MRDLGRPPRGWVVGPGGLKMERSRAIREFKEIADRCYRWGDPAAALRHLRDAQSLLAGAPQQDVSEITRLMDEIRKLEAEVGRGA